MKYLREYNESGQYSGLFEEWYEDGQIATSGRYYNGVQEDKWTIWSKVGTIESEGSYKNGIKVGKWIEPDFYGTKEVDYGY